MEREFPSTSFSESPSNSAVQSNFDGTGIPVHIVFGKPVEFGDLLTARGSPRTYRAIAERTLEMIAKLGGEERAIRAAAP
jgi:hypothetical protein